MPPRDIEKDTFLYNGRTLPVDAFDPEQATRYPSVYEVIRVIDGVPLFWESHLNRLQKSLALAGTDALCPRDLLHEEMIRLIRENRVTSHNLKIILNGFDQGRAPDRMVLFITSRYPTEEQLSGGVPVITHRAVRANPNAKIISADFRTPIFEALQQTGAYEALLVNPEEEITEGSRSNFFVIKEGVFYTPPADRVLEGITRQVVIKLLERLGYPLVTAPIARTFLREADGLFLTGTSPGVLPINRVDQQPYPTNLKPLQDVQKLFRHFVQTYISIHQP